MTKEWVFDSELENRRQSLVETGFDCYCLQTMASNEIDLARELNILHPFALALPFVKYMHKSKNGVKTTVQSVLLPGYVFLFMPQGESVWKIKRGGVSYRFVENMDKGDLVLRGSDKRYAHWVFNSGGILGMSKAIKVNGRVKVVGGPLYNMVGNIKEYSKKNRNCRIEITFFNRIISMWLPFQWVEEVPDDTPDMKVKESGDSDKEND
ncbi:MAG: transcription termination/antitermination protein NusG [Candidatus Ornithospirochaeta sp.]